MFDESDESGGFVKNLSKLAENNDPIETSLYEKYDVKRGLRYSDGRGVLVGLTRIGDVVGYEIDSTGKKLLFRAVLFTAVTVSKILSMIQNGATSSGTSSAFICFCLVNFLHSASLTNLHLFWERLELFRPILQKI